MQSKFLRAKINKYGLKVDIKLFSIFFNSEGICDKKVENRSV